MSGGGAARTPIRYCPAADAPPAGLTRYAVPAGAVDSHAHVIGRPPAHAFVENRSCTTPAPPAPVHLAMR
ncbi:GntR family transcriptional regulator, partial [Methylobacterium sp. J-059]|nr:GntR family transcriptional regulator [Methylobacterium sp. J-059]